MLQTRQEVVNKISEDLSDKTALAEVCILIFFHLLSIAGGYRHITFASLKQAVGSKYKV